jgi:hypothetical protein
MVETGQQVLNIERFAADAPCQAAFGPSPGRSDSGCQPPRHKPRDLGTTSQQLVAQGNNQWDII